jgi:hypothetical protein
MTNESVRAGASPRAPKPGQSQPSQPGPAQPGQPPAQPQPGEEAAPGSGSRPDSAPGSAPADWLAGPQDVPGRAPAPAPETDWLAPEGPEVEPEAGVPAESEIGPELEFEAEPEPGSDTETEFEPAPDYAPTPIANEFGDEALEGEEDLQPGLSIVQRLRRTSPAVVILGLAAIGSAAFMAFEIASHTAPIPVLTSAGVVIGVVYGVVTIACAIASYRAAAEGQAARSYLLAFVGGGAAIVACGSFAGALILFLALGF